MSGPWTSEETVLLRAYADAGYSAKQAGEKLGRSRNSAIGRAFREGIQFKGRVVLSPIQVVRRKAQCATNTAARVAKASTPRVPKPPKASPSFRFGRGHSTTIKPPRALALDVWAPLEGLTHRPWTTRRGVECCWPLDVDGEVHSCCRPIERGGYCETHADLAYQPTQTVSRKEVEWTARRYAA